MSEKNSEANRKRWAKVPKKERSSVMSKIASDRQASLTPAERRRNARKMVRARKDKRGEI